MAWLVIGYPLGAFLSFWLLWVFFLAVMNLARVKRAGQLTGTAYALGMPVLLIGYLLDFLVNVLVLSVLLLELPEETTCTARLRRHHMYSVGWRLRLVLWFEPLLDPFDPSGDHI